MRLMHLGFLSLGLCLSFSSVASRDPTASPLNWNQTSAPEARQIESLSLPSVNSGSMTIIRKDGILYLVVGSMLHAQGSKVGDTLIERIGESEVWLKKGGIVQKIPIFLEAEKNHILIKKIS